MRLRILIPLRTLFPCPSLVWFGVQMSAALDEKDYRPPPSPPPDPSPSHLPNPRQSILTRLAWNRPRAVAFKAKGMAPALVPKMNRANQLRLAPGTVANYRNMEALVSVLRLLTDGPEHVLNKAPAAVELGAWTAFFAIAWSEDYQSDLKDPRRRSQAYVSSAVSGDIVTAVPDPKYRTLQAGLTLDHMIDYQWSKYPKAPQIFVVNTDWNTTAREWVEFLDEVGEFLLDYSEHEERLVVFWEPAMAHGSRRFRLPRARDSEATRRVFAHAVKQITGRDNWPSWMPRGFDGKAESIARFMRRRILWSARPAGDPDEYPANVRVVRVPCGPMDLILALRAKDSKTCDAFSEAVGRHPLMVSVGQPTAIAVWRKEREGMSRLTGAIHFSGEIEPGNRSRQTGNPSEDAIRQCLRRKYLGLPLPAESIETLIEDGVTRYGKRAFAGFSWHMARGGMFVARAILSNGKAAVTLVDPHLPTLRWATPVAPPSAVPIRADLKSLDADLKRTDDQIIAVNLDWGPREVKLNPNSWTAPDEVRYPKLDEQLRVIGQAISRNWESVPGSTVLLVNLPGMRTDLPLTGADANGRLTYRGERVAPLLDRCLTMLAPEQADYARVYAFIDRNTACAVVVRKPFAADLDVRVAQAVRSALSNDFRTDVPLVITEDAQILAGRALQRSDRKDGKDDKDEWGAYIEPALAFIRDKHYFDSANVRSVRDLAPGRRARRNRPEDAWTPATRAGIHQALLRLISQYQRAVEAEPDPKKKPALTMRLLEAIAAYSYLRGPILRPAERAGNLLSAAPTSPTS